MFHRNTEKLDSLIGNGSMLKGNISSQGTLRIDGTLEGDISADWVVVGEKAHVTGNISSRGIVVGGRVDGNLRAKEVVEIKNKGSVYGEIFAAKLNIAEGAVFEGRSSMMKEDSKVGELAAAE